MKKKLKANDQTAKKKIVNILRAFKNFEFSQLAKYLIMHLKIGKQSNECYFFQVFAEESNPPLAFSKF